MNTRLEQAVARVRTLPASMQEEAARILLIYAGDEGPMADLTPEEEADLLEAQDEMARGDFATDVAVQAVFDKYRLGGSDFSPARSRKSIVRLAT